MSEKESEKIHVSTGFVKVRVELEASLGIPSSFLAFTPVFVVIGDFQGNILIQQAVPIQTTHVFPLNPGVFKISAKLGTVRSEAKNVEVKPGEVTEITISFGK